MKKIFNTLVVAICSIALFSCNQENIDYPAGDGCGKVDLSSLTVTYDESEVIMRSTDTQDFIVSIYERNSETVTAQWSYKNLPEIFTLTQGAYTLEVKSHNPESAAWDAPYYYAKKDFDIITNKVTPIGNVVCKLSNVKVTVEFSSELMQVMSNDCRVNIGLGQGTLDFTREESRAGYFTVTNESNRLYAYFIGTVDGVVDTTYREIENVKAGEWRIIRYSLKSTVEDEKEIGSFKPSIYVDVTCFTVEQDVQIPVKEEEIIADPEPSTPDTPEPQPNGPTIKATAFDIDEPQIINENLIIKVEVTSESPLKGFTVDIESTTLTPSELEAVGLATHLDLANPGNFRPQLEGLGFPVAENVVGQTAISFDITPFGSMLAALGAGTHKFIMTATDEAGNTTEKTLTLISE